MDALCVSVIFTRPGVLEEIIHNLDYCDLLVLGTELSPERESLQLHHASLQGKHLDATNSTSGISIYGVDSMSNYEQVIRQVRYHSWHMAELSERKFRLTCSELNGRYTSNEFNLEVSVLHSSQAVDHVNHMAAQPQYLQAIHHPVLAHSQSSAHSPAIPSAATMVIVMCIAALVVIVVLGIYRIHNLEEPQAADEEGSEEEEDEEEEDDDEDEEEEELDDDITSVESEDSDEEATDPRGPQERKRRSQLDWDSTTLPY
ncbi:hypothetical protein JZ751_013386 [Albula glossodonta]|uniref:Calsyntenin C-terminal domain-containing protein n=1 Tax=Albula glossodonta TaxID=121402 RepID=A0A8T2MXY0_9TELE|nr:hypothetical protein JZ751_013386 [Albula glossodonta]